MAGGRKVVLGVILGAHGIKGQVKLRSFTANPADIAGYGALDGSDGASHAIRSIASHKSVLLATLAGVSDRTAAEALRGVELSVPRERLPEPDEDEIYHADLVGLTVIAGDGREIGEVIQVLNYGAGDLIEVRPANGGSTLLLPFNRRTVPEINLAAGTLTVDPPSGLLEDD